MSSIKLRLDMLNVSMLKESKKKNEGRMEGRKVQLNKYINKV